MGSKSQHKKERHEQKRKEKRKKQAQVRDNQLPPQTAGNARHRERISQQAPVAWPGELLEDQAVFDDAALSALTPELATQVRSLREALQNALESRPQEALKLVAGIPRGSSLSEWRLYLRGLVDWLANQRDAASETWMRLDPLRRPGRIATSMMLAVRSDLEQAIPTESQPDIDQPDNQQQVSPSDASPWNRFDVQQLYHAKLLRKIRFDRAALRIAEVGLNVPDEFPDLLLGPKKVQWLRAFITEYKDTEPQLTAALERAAIARAFAQPFVDVFDHVRRLFRGPVHDPYNRLLSVFYHRQADDEDPLTGEGARALHEYLNRDLPQNENISAPLREAIASQIHLCEAVSLARLDSGVRTILDRLFSPPVETKAIQSHFEQAEKAAPNNSLAFAEHYQWIKSRLDDDRTTRAEQAKLEAELFPIMQNWSSGCPNQLAPRLWLVDYLMENERLEEALPHVDFLNASRQNDPLVRATPWKWQLLEAMRLCRRKAWLKNVPSHLDKAESLWPEWMSRQWLPYLRAAWELRAGRLDALEERRQQISAETGRARDSLADAFMLFGAAQQMRVPAADLKRLRGAVDSGLRNLNKLSREDLLETTAFFWDLHRARLSYPAMRFYSKTIGLALLKKLEKETAFVVSNLDNETLQKGILWCSAHRFWSTSCPTKFPAFFSQPKVHGHPVFMAARLNTHLKENFAWKFSTYQKLGLSVREAAASQQDAYYRVWFVQLADQLDEKIEKVNSRFGGFPFGNPWDDDDEDDDDDLD